MKKYFTVFAVLVSLWVGAPLAMAQNDAQEEEDLLSEDLEYTYGSVVSVSPQTIVINEYNYESDQEIQVSYAISGETKFTKINSVEELVKDDNVDVYYKVVGEQKVAQLITKDDTSYGTETEDIDRAEMEDSEDVNMLVPVSNQETNQTNIDSSRG